MTAGIDIRSVAGRVACGVADKADRHIADILDRDKAAGRRGIARIVEELVEKGDSGDGAGLKEFSTMRVRYA